MPLAPGNCNPRVKVVYLGCAQCHSFQIFFCLHITLHFLNFCIGLRYLFLQPVDYINHNHTSSLNMQWLKMLRKGKITFRDSSSFFSFHLNSSKGAFLSLPCLSPFSVLSEQPTSKDKHKPLSIICQWVTQTKSTLNSRNIMQSQVHNFQIFSLYIPEVHQFFQLTLTFVQYEILKHCVDDYK